MMGDHNYVKICKTCGSGHPLELSHCPICTIDEQSAPKHKILNAQDKLVAILTAMDFQNLDSLFAPKRTIADFEAAGAQVKRRIQMGDIANKKAMIALEALAQIMKMCTAPGISDGLLDKIRQVAHDAYEEIMK